MLIAVIINFLLCQSPHLVSTLMWALAPEVYKQEVAMKFYMITTLLILINSSTNFFVYALFGKRFRRKLVEVYCACLVPAHARGKRGSSFSLPNDTNNKPLLPAPEHADTML